MQTANHLTRNTINHASGTSIPRSFNAGESNNLGDSVAHPDRPPIRLQGLTAFLRKDYYRKLGVYINRARDEPKKLLEFWKDYVSAEYKKLREEKLMMLKMKDPYYVPEVKHSQCVPSVGIKSDLERNYEAFCKAMELDVAMTIEKDLEEEV